MVSPKKAFTLIELLVVIAIIAILAAILFPVFAQAKAAAKAAVGLSNQKQLGMSLQIYLGDYDDTFPVPYMQEAQTVPGTDDWGGLFTGSAAIDNPGRIDYERKFTARALLHPYIKSYDLHRDPMDVDVRPNPTTVTFKRASSYLYRFYLVTGFIPGTLNDPRRGKTYTTSTFQEPANSFVFHDYYPWSGVKYAPLPQLNGGQGWSPDTKITCVMADTHAKRFPVGKALRQVTYAPGWDYNWPRRGTERDDWNNALRGEPDLD